MHITYVTVKQSKSSVIVAEVVLQEQTKTTGLWASGQQIGILSTGINMTALFEGFYTWVRRGVDTCA